MPRAAHRAALRAMNRQSGRSHLGCLTQAPSRDTTLPGEEGLKHTCVWKEMGSNIQETHPEIGRGCACVHTGACAVCVCVCVCVW